MYPAAQIPRISFKRLTSAGLRLSYSIPAGSTGSTLTVVDIKGSVVAEYGSLSATSTVCQTSAPAMASSLYLAVLATRLASGHTVKRTIKVPVR